MGSRVTGSARRRALLIAAVALLSAGAAWIAVSVLEGTRIEWRDASGAPGVTVSAEMPAGTCHKELTASFPWVRFSCDRPDDSGAGEAPGEASGEPLGDRSEDATGGAAPASPSLDSAQDAE